MQMGANRFGSYEIRPHVSAHWDDTDRQINRARAEELARMALRENAILAYHPSPSAEAMPLSARQRMNGRARWSMRVLPVGLGLASLGEIGLARDVLTGERAAIPAHLAVTVAATGGVADCHSRGGYGTAVWSRPTGSQCGARSLRLRGSCCSSPIESQWITMRSPRSLRVWSSGWLAPGGIDATSVSGLPASAWR